jgi:NAD(P)-dependent dehydrogenase (short-subunit alcohol dehydrogenase family)
MSVASPARQVDAVAVEADVSDHAQVQRIREVAATTFGRVDV